MSRNADITRPRGLAVEPSGKPSADDRYRALSEAHESERLEELRTLRIPDRMRANIFQAADKLLRAVNLADVSEARKQAAELGLQHAPLFDYLRSKQQSDQYELAAKLINPHTLEIFGASSYRQAVAFRAGANLAAQASLGVAPEDLERSRHDVAREIHNARLGKGPRGRMCSADATGIPGADRFRRWNAAFADGESTQRSRLKKLITEDPHTSYAEHVGTHGLDTLISAISKYEAKTGNPEIDQASTASRHYALSRRHRAENTALDANIAREKRVEEVASSMRLGMARMEGGERVDPSFVAAVNKARYEPEKANPVLAQVVAEHDSKRNAGRYEAPPSSVTHVTPSEFKLIKSFLDDGKTFAMSDVGSFLRHYLYRNSTKAEIRAADGTQYENPLKAHARAGLRMIVDEYRAAGNQRAIDALAARVSSDLISYQERRQLFSPSPEETTTPKAGNSPRPREDDPFAVDTAEIERARKWSESLERFVTRQGKISRHDALQRAASLLTRRYKPEELQAIQSAARHDPRLEELAAVVARAEELIGSDPKGGIA